MKHDAAFVRDAETVARPDESEPDLAIQGPPLKRMMTSALINALIVGAGVLLVPSPHGGSAAVILGAAVFVISLHVLAASQRRRAARIRRETELTLELRRADRLARLAARGAAAAPAAMAAE